MYSPKFEQILRQARTEICSLKKLQFHKICLHTIVELHNIIVTIFFF